jgi:hypothetical protein
MFPVVVFPVCILKSTHLPLPHEEPFRRRPINQCLILPSAVYLTTMPTHQCRMSCHCLPANSYTSLCAVFAGGAAMLGSPALAWLLMYGCCRNAVPVLAELASWGWFWGRPCSSGTKQSVLSLELNAPKLRSSTRIEQKSQGGCAGAGVECIEAAFK